jgi:murein DD-endopeptidase MepM/ murein hydrolase activator NlpD
VTKKPESSSLFSTWISIAVVVALTSCGLLLLGLSYRGGLPLCKGRRSDGTAMAARNAEDAAAASGKTSADFIEEEYTLEADSTIFSTLHLGAKLANEEVQEIIAAAAPLIPLNKMQSGTKIILTRDAHSQESISLAFKLSPVNTLELRPNYDGTWSANMLSKQVETREFVFTGTVEDNLWNSAVNAGLDGSTVYTFAGIFEGQIDFYREVQPGDSWKMLVERHFIDGTPYQWGNILAGEYRKGEELFVGVRYEEANGSVGYYDSKGVSVLSAFLKSPIPYSRISSRFQKQRFHPILKINRPHLGVDYAAAHGTPVRAVGDGRVLMAGRASSNGIMVKISHSTQYQTAYKHLSKIAKGVTKNASVTQGQIIGYVGATGLATGPHLHFEFYENGRYTDPLGKRFPRIKTLAAAEMSRFKAIAESTIRRLQNKLVLGQRDGG